MKKTQMAGLILAMSVLAVPWLVGPTSSAGIYDPWYDLDDDGDIDIYDIVKIAGSYGTSGEPFAATAAIQYDSGWIDIADKCGQYFNVTHDLNSTDIIVDIQGKMTEDGGVHQRNLGKCYTPGWSRMYGGVKTEFAYSLLQTSDGGYAMAGETWSFGAGMNDFYLVRTDSSGNLLWNRTYGGVNRDLAYCVIQTSDGGYALAGYRQGEGTIELDFYLVKTDPFGYLMWNKTYGSPYASGHPDIARSVVQTSDGGYAIAGEEGAFELIWLVKTDSAGTLQWSRTWDFGGAGAHSILQTSDGGYVMAGYAFVTDSCLMKTDSNGVLQWVRIYGGTGHDDARDVVQTSDGGYALAGYTDSFGAGGRDFWLIKTDSNGIPQWNRTYGGSLDDEAYSVVNTSDGGYALAGSTESSGAGDMDYWLVKTDSAGNMQWNKTSGGISFDCARSVVQTGDGGYTLAGDLCTFEHDGNSNHDFYLVVETAELGLTWTDSRVDAVTFYRGATDVLWNFVRVRVWKIKDTP